jgi:hypothetical protein
LGDLSRAGGGALRSKGVSRFLCRMCGLHCPVQLSRPARPSAPPRPRHVAGRRVRPRARRRR